MTFTAIDITYNKRWTFKSIRTTFLLITRIVGKSVYKNCLAGARPTLTQIILIFKKPNFHYIKKKWKRTVHNYYFLNIINYVKIIYYCFKYDFFIFSNSYIIFRILLWYCDEIVSGGSCNPHETKHTNLFHNEPIYNNNNKPYL